MYGNGFIVSNREHGGALLAFFLPVRRLPPEFGSGMNGNAAVDGKETLGKDDCLHIVSRRSCESEVVSMGELRLSSP